jgi:integrase
VARREKEGEVIVREWKRGTGFALRFRAYGERRYLTLGYEGEGDPPLDLDRAEEELDNILADVRRGLWVPPSKKKRGTASSSNGDEGEGELVFFGPFAGDLVASREGQVSDNHLAYLEWGLRHLNPYFAERALIEFDAELVDAYRLHKVKEAATLAEAIDRGRPRRDAEGRIRRPLSAVSINKTIDVLQWVLGVAVEYKKRTGLTENPAVGTKRRLVEPDRRPVHLDSAEQIEALLLAGAELDRDPRCHCEEREAIVATLVFAGPRAHELGYLLWRDVDLANGRIFVGRSKTRAGLREIQLQPILRDILAAHKARAYRSGPDDLVFPTGTGGRRDKDNLRERVLELLFERADKLLIDRGRVPLPIGLTAHKLRHTFASVLIAIGEDPVSVKEALGHTTPGFTLSVYTHMMKRDKAERARLKALVAGERVLVTDAPPPEIIALGAYEPAILRGLAERGGRARRRDVVDAVGEALAARHSTTDLERLPSGQPRWKPRVAKVWTRLEQRGWIEAGGGRGDWMLTATGRAKVASEAAPPVEVGEPERRLRLVA